MKFKLNETRDYFDTPDDFMWDYIWDGRETAPLSAHNIKIQPDGRLSRLLKHRFEPEQVINLDISGDVDIVPESMFEDCINLESVIMHEGTKTIDVDAFANCTSLNYVKLPRGLQELGENVFDSCEKLESIFLPESLVEIDRECFSNCSRLNDIFIPDNVSYLGDKVFDLCTSLQYVRLPDSLDRLYRAVFRGCGNLKQVELPSQLKSIGSQCFCATGVEEIILPKQLMRINQEAFNNCLNLKHVVFNKDIQYIGDYVFNQQIENVEYEGTVEQWEHVERDEQLIKQPVKCLNGLAYL